MKATILAVEDNEDLQSIYRKLLGDKYDLHQALDSEKAWKILGKHKIDLILLDIILSKGMQGDELSLQLMSHPKYKSIPIIFITVVEDQIKAGYYGKTGHTSWLTKPFKEEQLLQKIEEKLKHRKS